MKINYESPNTLFGDFLLYSNISFVLLGKKLGLSFFQIHSLFLAFQMLLYKE